MTTMFQLRWFFGSSFAGQVCDDGPSGAAEYETLEETKEALQKLCDRQQCQVGIARDGLSADFYNWGDQLTGGARIQELVPACDGVVLYEGKVVARQPSTRLVTK